VGENNEHIVAPAIKVGESVYRGGMSHADILEWAQQLALKTKNPAVFEELDRVYREEFSTGTGFWTSAGRYVTRVEATAILRSLRATTSEKVKNLDDMYGQLPVEEVFEEDDFAGGELSEPLSEQELEQRLRELKARAKDTPITLDMLRAAGRVEEATRIDLIDMDAEEWWNAADRDERLEWLEQAGLDKSWADVEENDNGDAYIKGLSGRKWLGDYKSASFADIRQKAFHAWRRNVVDITKGGFLSSPAVAEAPRTSRPAPASAPAKTADPEADLDDAPDGVNALFSMPTQGVLSPRQRLTTAIAAVATKPTLAGRILKMLGYDARQQKAIKGLYNIAVEMYRQANVPFRKGRGIASWALGHYNPAARAVRIKDKSNVATAAHEFGHFISDFVLKNPTMRGAAQRGAAKLTAAMHKELMDMGKRLYGSKKPVGGYREEGIAEWGKFYVTDPARMRQEAPEFSAFMDEQLKQWPELKAILDGARSAYQQYQSASPLQRAATVLAASPKNALQHALDRLTDMRGHVGRWFEDTPVLREAVETLSRMSGQAPSVLRDAYKILQASRHMYSYVEEQMTSGVIDLLTGQPATRGFFEVWEEVPEVYRKEVESGARQRVDPDDPIDKEALHQFRTYLLAERHLEMLARGIEATAMETDDARAVVAAASPDFKRLAKDLYDISDALLQQRVDVGLLDPSDAAKIRQENQKRYGPMWRDEIGEGDAPARAPGTGGRRLVQNTAGVHRLEGSERDVLWPDQALALDILDTAKRVTTHRASVALIQQAIRTQGGGIIAEEVPAPKDRTVMSLAQIRDQLIALGFDPMNFIDKNKLHQMAAIDGLDTTGMKDIEILDALLDGMSKRDQGLLISQLEIQALLEAFNPRTHPTANDRRDLVIATIINGKRRWFQINDRELFDALQGLGPQQLAVWDNLIGQAAWRSTRLLRAGATLTLEFMGRNWFRDAFNAAVYTRADGKGAARLGKANIPFYLAIKGLRTMLNTPAAVAQWRREFGKGGSLMAQDREFMQDLIDKELKHRLDKRRKSKPRRVLDALSHPIELLRAASDFIENTTRVGEHMQVKEDAAKHGVGQQQAAAEGAHASGDVTLRFSGGGTAARQLNMWIAFLNPTMLDLRKFHQEFITAKDPARRKALWLRGMALITVPSLALAALQGDDEEYLAIPEWQRNAAWILVWRGFDGKVDHIFRFPKPQLLGFIFGTIPERLFLAGYRGLKGKGDAQEQLKSLFGALGQQVIPNLVPTIAAGVAEWWANKSTYRGTPLVPRTRQDLPRAYQTADYTGEFAQQVGELIPGGASPAKIENLARVHGGTMGTAALTIADAATRAGRKLTGQPAYHVPTTRQADWMTRAPVLRGFTVRRPLEDAQSVKRFYDTFFKAEQHRQRWRDLVADREVHRANKYLNEHRDAIRSVATSEETGDEAGVLRQAYQLLSNKRRDMSQLPPAKRAEVGREVREIAEKAMSYHRRERK
jgi:hypothetical protein